MKKRILFILLCMAGVLFFLVKSVPAEARKARMGRA